MALKKLTSIEGEAYIHSLFGPVLMGQQKTSFSAYCKIVQILGDKEKGEVVVECKADQYKMTLKFEVPFSVEDGSPNFIKQAYEHLKTLPEFEGATDC